MAVTSFSSDGSREAPLSRIIRVCNPKVNRCSGGVLLSPAAF
jgi:hypothetical protein